MKIGIFTDSYIPQKNGVTTAVENLRTSLEKKGHEVYLIAPKYPDFDSTDRIIRLPSLVVERGSKSRFALYFPAPSMREALKIDYDIIHGHSGGPITLLGWEVARRKKVPYVFTYHTLWKQYIHYFLKGKLITPTMVERTTRIFCNLTSAVIAPSERIKRELNSYGVVKDIHVIPNGIDTSFFAGNHTNYLHTLLDIPNSTSIVLSVGRLGKEKSFDLLIKAFARIKDDQSALVIFGNGPERKKLEELIKKLRIEERVFLPGNVDYEQISAVYRGADIFAFPSRTETQGMVILEAMASRLPIVTLDRSPFNEILTHNETALLAKYTIPGLAENLSKLLTDSHLRDSLRTNAYNLVKTYETEKTSAALTDLYEDLLKNPEKNNIHFKERLLGYIKRAVLS